jgi:small subunit ribosomal protein S1
MERQEHITNTEPAQPLHEEEQMPRASGSDEENEEQWLMEQFRADPAHGYPRLQYGETLDGTIMRIDKEGILVDIGAKSEGIVPTREMQSLTTEDRAALQVGDHMLVFVIQAENQEGHAVLSVDKARQEKSWRALQEVHQSGDPIDAEVVNYNKGGLLVNLNGVRGFVPASQVEGIARASDAQKQSDMARMIGQILTLKVIEINRDRNRLILSERQAMLDAREEKKEELLASLQEGNIYTGTISSICDFGAFVDIGGADGLVHLSELSWGRVNHPSELLHVGQEVNVYILSIDNERKRIALSLKRTRGEPWSTVSERYHLGQVVEGTITQLAPFGAFACLEEGIEGLIHLSEMGEGNIQHPRDVLQEEEVVQVRIIRIDPSRKRMGLSLRLTPEPDTPQDNPGDEESNDG